MWSDVFVATGSGGTAAGLAIGNYLTGSTSRVHAVTVCDSAAYFLGHCQDMLDALELDVRAETILSVVDGYKGAGYGLATSDEVQWQVDIAHASGLVLDSTYTGKGLRGAVEAAAAHEDQTGTFQPSTTDGTLGDAFHGLAGYDLLFWHTGGVFGAMEQSLSDRFAGRELQSSCQPTARFQQPETRV
jgi:1-aminocyclopropane-1-carboxylate deaminase/D-cysteine desulfhydrase-like pyridoxal-dependent ACC family enzyme